MLRLITGRAGAGKTALVIRELREAALRGESALTLIVPEQYSHEAERELCREVGDSLSLHAEVLSFTGLARRIEGELGSGGRVPLDNGGRLLCMALALDAVGARLSVYGRARRSPELQKCLLDAVTELKAAGIPPELLSDTAAACGGSLSAKLKDLALVLGAYDASVGMGRADPADRLDILLQNLPRSAFGLTGRIYLDGFTDFTAQELRILRALMARGAELCVCLTCDGVDGDSEVFELSRRTARALLAEARERNIAAEVIKLELPPSSPVDIFAEGLFSYSAETLDCGAAVSLFSADSVAAECELAAARAIGLCRDHGARRRDIAIAVRGFEDYRPSLEAAFAYYGVPLFTARKSDILQKPLPALLAAAYEIPAGGWETDDVFAYLRTGLAGLSESECDTLENYCLLWSCRASRWLSEKDWRMHPDGYGGTYDDKALAKLAEINALRRRVAEPLLALQSRAKAAVTALEQVTALWRFMDELKLAKAIAARADALEARGRPQAAAEYQRLWDITVSALEQLADLLGDTELDADGFSRLFMLTLSQYDVGIIPVSLDMVTAGDMDRMRRRSIKHLIILGASDERLPAGTADGGVFSQEERRALSELGLPLDAGDAELWREYTLIYNCVSLPSETLTLVTPTYDSDGAAARPSFVISRAMRLFGLPLLPADTRMIKTAAPRPAMELAAASLRLQGSGLEARAAEYFSAHEAARLEALSKAAAMTRGRLSADSVRSLYGEKLRLSASRIDSFASCRFSYFLKYGLLAKPRRAAEFSPPEFGTFMHYILEHVASEAESAGGLGSLKADELAAMTDKYIEKYIVEELNGFEGESPRFVYLFRRLTKSVRRIVADMAEELGHSDFRPLDFELNFGAAQGIPDLPLPEGGSLRLTGIADRIDGWTHNGRLYLRVIDYKTGRKSFSLSDVRYGMGLQLLLYLFTLEKCGEARYGMPIAPAGVLYVPARDPLISSDHYLTDEELAKKRAAGLQRSGLLLGEADVLFAMEDSETPLRLPVKWKDGVPSGEALASAEQLGSLARHVEETLRAMAGEIKCGGIDADPYYKAAQDNACLYCDYADACRLRDGEDGDHRRYLQKLPATRVWNILEGGERNG
ncbi:MAG: PD-(D/E)XK nuclease family protein [Oscillospiraceae bacterium]